MEPAKYAGTTFSRLHDENNILLSAETAVKENNTEPLTLSSYLSKQIPIPCKESRKPIQLRRRKAYRGVKRLLGVILLATILLMFSRLLSRPFEQLTPFRFNGSANCNFYNTSRNVADYLLPGIDLLEPHQICDQHNELFLLIVVTSTVDNFFTRRIIRQTWGNTTEFNYNVFSKIHSNYKGQNLSPSEERLRYYRKYLKLEENQTISEMRVPVRIVFMIGRRNISDVDFETTEKMLQSESEKYQDIVQSDFIDTYNNLTLKSLLALRWATRRCANHAAYFMKCDDDTFVNLPNLLHYLLGGTIPIYKYTLHYFGFSALKALKLHQNFIVGRLLTKEMPDHRSTSKAYMPRCIYKAMYPDFLSGSAYVMPMDIVPRLYETALNTPLIHLEDVYITGICAEQLHLKRIHQPLFSFNDFSYSSNLCEYKSILTQHNIKNFYLAVLYDFVSKLKHDCLPPP